MPIMECVACGHVQQAHPKFAYCDECGGTQFRRASASLPGRS